MAGGKQTFNLTLLFNLDEMDAEQKQLFKDMGDAAHAAALKKFGVKLGEEYPKGSGLTLRSPFRKSEEKPKHMAPGRVFVRFSTEDRCGVVDESRDPITKESRDFYAGCWAHVSWSVYHYDEGGNRGVAFGFRNVQKTDDDEEFGEGRTTPEDDFEDLSQGEPAGVAADSGDDEIPF